MREAEWNGADGFVPGTAWEDFGDSAEEIEQEGDTGFLNGIISPLLGNEGEEEQKPEEPQEE